MKIKIDLFSNIYYSFCNVKKNTCLCLIFAPLLLGCKVIKVAVDVVVIYVVAVVVVVVAGVVDGALLALLLEPPCSRCWCDCRC